ncbi:MAG: transglutaminase domain-containing protein [Phycisphaerales bacterium]|nr:transglutaminase domain-containing protein [Phycisphaerales bacterium]
MRRFNALTAMLLCLLVVGVSSVAVRADTTFERWYVALMSGQRVGWMHALEQMQGDQIITSSETVLTIARGRATIEIRVESRFVETDQGVPVSAWSKTLTSAVASEIELTFNGDGSILQRSTLGDHVVETTMPAPDADWLPPAAAGRFVEEQLQAGAKRIVVTMLEPSLGVRPITVTRDIIGETTVEAMGRTVPAVEWESTMDIMPGIKTTEFVDPEDGDVIRTVMEMGIIRIEMVAADRELAMSKLEPGELMGSTLVEPDRSIRRPRKSTRASYVLSVADGEMPEIRAAGGQRVERLDDGRVRVTIDVDDPLPAGDDPDIEHALDASTFVNHENPLIVSLTKQAVADASDDPYERAEAIRTYVFTYVSSKDLSVGFASATETARSRQGDCSEHGVLMAAMLRADGIPSRVASGLIYADQFLGRKGVFGYHMWTQALLPGEDGEMCWVDFDSAWPRRTDATHILLQTSSASDDGPITNDLVSLVPLMGRLRIEVESVE